DGTLEIPSERVLQSFENGNLNLFDELKYGAVYLNKLLAPDAVAGDLFGGSVAISGDKIVVGSYGDDDNGSDSGSAYIFNTDGSYVTKITAPDGEADDNFGRSVSISGDKIVVGAIYDDDNGSNSGSAWVFQE
ncbi:MAG: FG-GAP repeat protein, partial [Candidatus Caldatribacteriota bacterium]|nr:FG-GAP repeat protein [Candidatus Caldatribacteriota bacterium]